MFSLRAREEGLQLVVLTKGLAARIKVWASSPTSFLFSAWQRWRSVQARTSDTLTAFIFTVSQFASHKESMIFSIWSSEVDNDMAFTQSVLTHDW